MSPSSAVAWLEGRRVALAVAVLLVFGTFTATVMPLIAGPFNASVQGVVNAFAAVLAALVLGAELFSADAGAPFLASRAISPVRSALIRLAVRTVGAAAMCALPFVISAALESAGAGEQARMASEAAPFLALLFLSAALASAFTSRAMAAIAQGGLVALGATGLAVVAGRLLAEGWEPWMEVSRNVLIGAVLPLLVLAVLGMAKLRGNAAFRPDVFALRLALGFAVLAILAIAGGTVIGRLVGIRRFEAGLATWRQVAGSEPLPALADAPSSPAALEADAIACRIGACLGPRKVHEPLPTRAALPAEVGRELDDWLDDATTRADVLVLPARLAAHVNAHAADLAALHDAVASGAVTWETSRMVWGGAPRPDGAGHLRLMRLLGASALEHERSGDDAAVRRDLATMRALTESIRRHPSIEASSTACSASRFHARVARCLASLPEGWIDGERVGELRAEAWVARAREVDAGIRVATGEDDAAWGRREDFSPLVRAAQWLWSPLTLTESGAELRLQGQLAERARRVDGCGLLMRPETRTLGRVRQPSFDFVDGFRSSERGVRRAVATQMDWELTRLIHELRAWRSVNPGPDAELPPEIQRLCPGLPWVVTLEGSTGFTVRASPRVFATGRATSLDHHEPSR